MVGLDFIYYFIYHEIAQCIILSYLYNTTHEDYNQKQTSK
jgi:hypothetical protein